MLINRRVAIMFDIRSTFRSRLPRCAAFAVLSLTTAALASVRLPTRRASLEVRIGHEPRRLTIFQYFRIEHADVLSLLPSAIRLFSDVAPLSER